MLRGALVSFCGVAWLAITPFQAAAEDARSQPFRETVAAFRGESVPLRGLRKRFSGETRQNGRTINGRWHFSSPGSMTQQKLNFAVDQSSATAGS